MKKSSIIFLVLVSFTINFLTAQQSLNDYKYVIVPNQFDFLSEPDQHQLNSLTKFLLKKHNFNALMKDEQMPEDLSNNGCIALKANLVKTKSVFKSKLQVELINCNNDIVFKTDVGESRQKEYKKAYHEALRNAFKSFQSVNYKYKAATPKAEVKQNDVIQIKEEPKKVVVAVTEISKQKEEQVKKKVKAQKIITTNNAPSDASFMAAEIFNGYTLTNSGTKETITLFNSGVNDIYIVKGKDAIVYKKGGDWIYSETTETNRSTKRIDIKF